MQAICDSIRRLRPLLGTFVEISAAGAGMAKMESAVEAAFTAIGTVHRLMSFHDEGSDVSRLNRDASAAAIQVHPWTFEVLETALDLHSQSRGLFDIRIAPALQRLGVLPRHGGAETASAASGPGQGKIELLTGQRVRFHDKATGIDLGGIAKGYAVDRAIESLRDFGVATGLVNAGGDLAGYGPESQLVTVRDPGFPSRALCQIELRDEALASSGAGFDPARFSQALRPEVIDPRSGETVCAVAGATVRAPSCFIADALTKIVMIGAETSAPMLRRFGASALFVTADGEVRVSSNWQSAAVLAA